MWASVIGIGVALIAAFAGGWQVRDWKAGADEREQLKQVIETTNKAIKDGAESSEKLEKSLTKLRPIYRTINNEVQREVVQHTVYTDCVVTPDGVRLVNRGVHAANNPGQPDLPVPITVIPPRQSNDGRPAQP